MSSKNGLDIGYPLILVFKVYILSSQIIKKEKGQHSPQDGNQPSWGHLLAQQQVKNETHLTTKGENQKTSLM
jgi:hypothetical protein